MVEEATVDCYNEESRPLGGGLDEAYQVGTRALMPDAATSASFYRQRHGAAQYLIMYC
jgi:hypothetical protein